MNPWLKVFARRVLVMSIGLVVSLAAVDAGAVKYMSLGDAVKTFIPADAKIVKVTKGVGAVHKKQLEEDYGWTPTESEYVFYAGRKGDETVAYVFVVPEIFNTCFHKYAVGMKPDGTILETVIVELSCPRAFPVNRKSFLGQFGGKEHTDPLTTRSDIDAVTGATLSSEATATAARKAVSLHNVFFGRGDRVKVSSDVKVARAKAQGMIQKAIETGETLAKDGQPAAAVLPEGE